MVAVELRRPWIAEADFGYPKGGFGYYGWRGGVGWNAAALAEVDRIVQDIVAAVRRNPCSERVRIVAHSYGARIATEVVFRLAAYGIPVDLLVTLDPVGDAYAAEGMDGVPGKVNEAAEDEEDGLDSDTGPRELPVPKVGLWINVQSVSKGDPSDWIAGIGGRWGNMAGIADENLEVDIPHGNVMRMMGMVLSSGETLMDLLVEKILVQYEADT